jgi:hypothetical protein
VQFVDEQCVARFGEAVGESWNLEPMESTVLGEGDGMVMEDTRVLEGSDIVEDLWQDKIEERPKLRQIILGQP